MGDVLTIRKMNKKGFCGIIFLIFLAIILIGVVFALFIAIIWILLVIISIIGLIYGIALLQASKKKGSNAERAIAIIVTSSLILIFSLLMVFSASKGISRDKDVFIQEPEKNYALLSENCAKISDEHKRNFCYKDLAEESGNPEFCDMMEFMETEDYGNNKNYCFKNVAIETLNESICEFIEQDEDRLYPEIMENECYSEIAQNKNDPYICLKITVDYRDWERQVCIYEIALDLEDPSICEIWESEGIGRGTLACKDNIYEKLATS